MASQILSQELITMQDEIENYIYIIIDSDMYSTHEQQSDIISIFIKHKYDAEDLYNFVKFICKKDVILESDLVNAYVRIIIDYYCNTMGLIMKPMFEEPLESNGVGHTNAISYSNYNSNNTSYYSPYLFNPQNLSDNWHVPPRSGENYTQFISNISFIQGWDARNTLGLISSLMVPSPFDDFFDLPDLIDPSGNLAPVSRISSHIVVKKDQPDIIENCKVCYTDVNTNLLCKLQCNHEFCSSCVKEIFTHPLLGYKCPMCRTPIQSLECTTEEALEHIKSSGSILLA
jgi:hypothetical protein